MSCGYWIAGATKDLSTGEPTGNEMKRGRYLESRGFGNPDAHNQHPTKIHEAMT